MTACSISAPLKPSVAATIAFPSNAAGSCLRRRDGSACPLWASPITAIFYTWRDRRFSFSTFRPTFIRELCLKEVPSFLIATWIVWIPATAIIYSLPLPLQVPLFNLVLCFFVLLVKFPEPAEGMISVPMRTGLSVGSCRQPRLPAGSCT